VPADAIPLRQGARRWWIFHLGERVKLGWPPPPPVEALGLQAKMPTSLATNSEVLMRTKKAAPAPWWVTGPTWSERHRLAQQMAFPPGVSWLPMVRPGQRRRASRSFNLHPSMADVPRACVEAKFLGSAFEQYCPRRAKVQVRVLLSAPGDDCPKPNVESCLPPSGAVIVGFNTP